MYLVPLKSALVEALRKHFNANYSNQDFQNVWISIEYPVEKQNYPGIWVTYEDRGELEKAGIDHREIITTNDGTTQEITRWRFTGAASFTCAALSSLERDRLFDEVIRTITFQGFEGPASLIFKDMIESNDFIALNGNYDVLTPSGEAAAPGTPWGTEEIIYEKTVTFDLVGEFISNPNDNTLVELSDIQVMGIRRGDVAPSFPDSSSPTPGSPPWNPNVWP